MIIGRKAAPSFCPGTSGKARALHSTASASTASPTPTQRSMRCTRGRYLAMPTAVMTFFMSASPLAMKAANSCELPHSTPKPRCAMKSLYSLLS